MEQVLNFPIKYGIMAVRPPLPDKGEMFHIVHFVGFQHPPTEYDWKGVEKELKEDLEFQETLKDVEYILMVAPQNVIDAVNDIIEAEDEEYIVRVDDGYTNS